MSQKMELRLLRCSKRRNTTSFLWVSFCASASMKSSDRAHTLSPIADLIMPVLSGPEATREIRRIEAERRRNGTSTIDSIIIALTASTLTEDHQMAMKAGCNDFILKPVSLRWLERKVREWGNIQGVIDYQNLEEIVERKYGFKKGA